jgi:hypothetical protein
MPVAALDQPSSHGTAKLNRGVSTRQTVGTESGDLLEDVQLVHELETAADLAALEPFLPGATAAYAAASGPQSTGPRQLQWAPKPGTIRMELENKSGVVIYGGPATIRRAHLRIVPTAAVLTIYARLEAMIPDESPNLLRELGQLVDYRVDWMAADSPGRAVTKDQTEFPFSGVDCEPGDLVTWGDGSRAGIVVSVGATSAIVRSSLVDSAEDLPVEVQAAEILTAVRICGPRGGPPDDALRRLVRTAPDVTPADLQLAIVMAQDTGGTELMDGAGWALTSTVISMAARLADPEAEIDEDDGPDPEQVDETDGDLPDPL